MIRAPYLVTWFVDFSGDGSQQLLDVAPLSFIEDGMMPVGKATAMYLSCVAHNHNLEPSDLFAEVRSDEWVERAYLTATLLEGVL